MVTLVMDGWTVAAAGQEQENTSRRDGAKSGPFSAQHTSFSKSLSLCIGLRSFFLIFFFSGSGSGSSVSCLSGPDRESKRKHQTGGLWICGTTGW